MSEHIACPVAQGARAFPDRVALLAPERVVTYAELNAFVEGVARSLFAKDVVPGARVGIYAKNQWRYIVTLMGILRAGLVACPVSTRWPMPRVQDALANIQAVCVLTDQPRDSIWAHLAYGLGTVAQEAAIPSETRPFVPGQDATIVFTSGSSGKPKAALHTIGNHYYSALGARENMMLEASDRWLLSLPLYHVGGLAIVFRCLWAGATVVVPQANMPLGQVLQAYSITHISLVATQLLRLLNEPVTILDSVKAMLLGGSTIPGGLLTEAYKRGLPVHTTYGLTEMASQVTTTPPNASATHLATSGRTLKHRALRVARDGEIEVKGPVRFKGYVSGDTIHQPFDANGWFATRDIGWLDDEGYLHVTGRKDNQFISGGENIQPEAIEQALVQVPHIDRAVVVPVPDNEFGERPVAFIQMRLPNVDTETLRQTLEQTLPRFMVPVAFYPWPTEQDTDMKISRAFFQERALQHQTIQKLPNKPS